MLVFTETPIVKIINQENLNNALFGEENDEKHATYLKGDEERR
ncbi:MAG: hypothetical protein AB1420_09710 [Bacillota bacterium]